MHPDCVLIKTSTDNSRWQTAQTMEVLGAYYTSGKAYDNFGTTGNTPWAKEALVRG